MTAGPAAAHLRSSIPYLSTVLAASTNDIAAGKWLRQRPVNSDDLTHKDAAQAATASSRSRWIA